MNSYFYAGLPLTIDMDAKLKRQLNGNTAYMTLLKGLGLSNQSYRSRRSEKNRELHYPTSKVPLIEQISTINSTKIICLVDTFWLIGDWRFTYQTIFPPEYDRLGDCSQSGTISRDEKIAILLFFIAHIEDFSSIKLKRKLLKVFRF